MEATKLVIESTIDGVAAADYVQPESAKAAPREFKRKIYKSDPYIWGIYITLLIFSIIELYSASSREVVSGNVYAPLMRHAKFLIIGFFIVIFFQRTHYKWFRKFALPIAIISILMLVYVDFFGANINNAQRAILLPGFGTIQPPEIAKVTCMLYIASVMAKHQMSGGVTTRGVTIAAVAVLIFCAYTIKNGLTNTIILMGASLCMFLISGIQLRKFFIVLAIYGVCGGLFVMMKDDKSDAYEQAKQEMVEAVGGETIATETATAAADPSKSVGRFDTWMSRVNSFLTGVSPQDSITDDNRQVVFAKFALANGGLTGCGPGKSRETARLPLAFCDYIFAIIIEDIGFVGGAILLLFYLCLIARAGRVASRCSRAFPALLIMGCAVVIVLQAIIHMAIVAGLFPVSGQPLPLISKGGTSILVMSAAIGMMLSVSRYAVRSGDKKGIKKELDELPAELHAENPASVN